MTAIARIAALDLRSTTPYRRQALVTCCLVVLVLAGKPVALVPALTVLVVPVVAAYPFLVADKADLETLYAVLPVTRRTVLYGHYAWAMAIFLATTAVSTVLALVLAQARAVPIGGRDLVTVLALSWALFAVNVAIQFPLYIRFGYTRTSMLSTSLPIVLVVMAIQRLHLTFTPTPGWIALLGLAGVVAFVASLAVAMVADRRRVRHSRFIADIPTGRA